ncbi:hypothetical protein MUN84_10935 [Hymenobacter sp. 5516J-16]|uniref:hypothetical protein n=1 Tax=Hymenobacter sp. 5516J-16 TaxID=2932253 RepID=UPI001FD1D776|nr:hypothetical protein [Hymenobacter sp. 5516J-16]UOQ78984.1 hypothetical protein MUN84_10935 [Hymenobacter sp. 5516J-16]
MAPPGNADASLAGRLAFYNAVPSVVWSGLSWGPLTVFCYQHMARPWLYGLLGVSLLGYVVPAPGFGTGS